mmetsp:Transcript_91316/g.212400  ORF Transcript_91316/g.212400 Transcript_91316/m.212400 type:complete len:186 (-) Transcript_91316:425-982(-)
MQHRASCSNSRLSPWTRSPSRTSPPRNQWELLAQRSVEPSAVPLAEALADPGALGELPLHSSVAALLPGALRERLPAAQLWPPSSAPWVQALVAMLEEVWWEEALEVVSGEVSWVGVLAGLSEEVSVVVWEAASWVGVGAVSEELWEKRLAELSAESSAEESVEGSVELSVEGSVELSVAESVEE